MLKRWKKIINERELRVHKETGMFEDQEKDRLTEGDNNLDGTGHCA
jgi:hypothetical protein